jgi:3-deoxy-D-manno-octulosonic-acid transferase
VQAKESENADVIVTTRIRRWTRIKWLFFRCLEWLSDLRGTSTPVPVTLGEVTERRASIWIFVSTIGELNAIDPFLKKLLEQSANLKTVLITDHQHYFESYQSRYPDSIIVVSKGHSNDARQLAEWFPPKLLVVGEIPCWPGDAPCRFSFAFLLEAKRHGAFACVVNGWLYHYPSSCRLDTIERRLFQRDYLAAFDVIAVQTSTIRDALIRAGASPKRISVTGNIKFDALPSSKWSTKLARSAVMLSSLLESKRPVIVAGCVTELVEQEMVLDAFVSVMAVYPDALLVLAPRHPEVKQRMQILAKLLSERGLPALFRSTIPDQAIAEKTACLVLDTIGELRDFYAAATVTYVGTDHNVLEPLGFEKPVTVKHGWNATYPSFPVYRMLLEGNCLQEAKNVKELSAYWLELLSNDHYEIHRHLIQKTLARTQGAVARHMALIEPWVGVCALSEECYGEKKSR